MLILWCYSVIDIVRGKSLSTYISYFQKNIYINSKEKNINQFAIVFMVNPTLHINKALIDQV